MEKIAEKIKPIKEQSCNLTKQNNVYELLQVERQITEKNVDNEECKNKAKVDDINFIHKVKICTEIKLLLIESHRIFIDYGPRSKVALKNPLSNACEIWKERKREKIIPNNEKIVHIIEDNKELFTIDEYEVCYKFIEHTNGFKKSCDQVMEDVKQFPKNFSEVINKYAKV